MNECIPFHERVCENCGKTFIMYPKHVFKRRLNAGHKNTKLLVFCKYTCMTAWEGKQVDKKVDKWIEENENE